MYKASIIINEDVKNIERLFLAEEKDFKKRASFEIKKQGNEIVFEIKAVDPVALKSVLNSIIKTLIIHKNIKIVEEELK